MHRMLEMGGQGRKALSVFACALLLGPSAATAADKWQVGTSTSFSSGKYGTDTRTEVFHTPVTARRLFRDGDLTIVFPFTCVTGNGSVTVVNGAPVRTDAAAEGDSRGGRTGTDAGRGTTDPSLATDTSALAPEATSCGVGDIVVRGRYYVLDERGWLPTVALRAHIKTPTASASRGLGTGRADEGMGVEVSRAIGGDFLVMADVGYTVIGKPAGADYKNTWWYSVGVGRDLADGFVNLSVFFEEYGAIVPGLPNDRDILAAVSLKGATGWRLQGAGQFGLSEGAPDLGMTIGASRRF